MSEHFAVEMRILGPEYERDTGYGPRVDRATLATLTVDADAAVAWEVFQHVTAQLTMPPTVVDCRDDVRWAI